MAWKVFEANDAVLGALETDDVASRQSLVVRDGSAWGVKGKLVIVSGTDEGVKRAGEIVAQHGGRPCDVGDKVKADLDKESDEAAGGMGFVFG